MANRNKTLYARDLELWEQAQALAAHREISLSKLVEEGLTLVLDRATQTRSTPCERCVVLGHTCWTCRDRLHREARA